MTRILVIDNYDSFVFTLVGYLQQLGAETTVIRNDEHDLDTVLALAAEHDGVLISPGPGAPADAGVIIDTIKWAANTRKPLLGVCLGHQAIAEAFGGTVTHAPELMHGKTSTLVHENDSVFKDVPSPFTATRYHSLAVVPDTMPEVLQVATHANPLRFGVAIARGVYLEGATFVDIVPHLIPLVVMIAVTLPLAAWLFRHRLG